MPSHASNTSSCIVCDACRQAVDRLLDRQPGNATHANLLLQLRLLAGSVPSNNRMPGCLPRCAPCLHRQSRGPIAMETLCGCPPSHPAMLSSSPLHICVTLGWQMQHMADPCPRPSEHWGKRLAHIPPHLLDFP